jgi:cytochrome P450
MTLSFVGRPSTAIRRWAGRRLLATSVGRRSGLTGVSVLPKKLTMPLRRVQLDPLPQLGAMRQDDAVRKLARVFGMNVWLVTGYEQARAVLSDSDHYSTSIRSLLGYGAPQSIGGLGFTDPPEHTRLRKFLTPEFTKHRLQRLQPLVEGIVADRLDAMEATGGVVDLVAEFAFPIPFLVICELLGLPVEDRARFQKLGHARFDITGGGAGTFGAMSESQNFLLEAVAKQRLNPGDGLIGAILREHGDEVDDLELAGLADGVFTGGYETSASTIALGALALLRDRESFGLLSRDPSAVGGAVDELLRYLSVVQIAFPRFAKVDLELFGKQVKAGDAVVCSLSAANRDKAFGPDSDSFDPSRAGRSHLAFGYGFHRCVGSELARMELSAAFRALARRYPDMQLAVAQDELRFHDLSLVYGLDSLPVRLLPDGAPE